MLASNFHASPHPRTDQRSGSGFSNPTKNVRLRNVTRIVRPPLAETSALIGSDFGKIDANKANKFLP